MNATCAQVFATGRNDNWAYAYVFRVASIDMNNPTEGTFTLYAETRDAYTVGEDYALSLVAIPA